MEALIYHFKIVMGETDVPKGEVYHCVEGGNGELRLLSDQRWRQTTFPITFPSTLFHLLPGLSEMIKGGYLSDAILTMSSMNVIAGELDA